MIVDGIDVVNCPSEVLESFDRLVASTSKLRVVILSRSNTAILSAMSNSPTIEVGPEKIRNGIELVIRTALADFLFEDSDQSAKLAARVMQKSNGMLLRTNEMLKSSKIQRPHLSSSVPGTLTQRAIRVL